MPALLKLKLKLKLNKALDENSFLSYGVSPAIWDHSVTCHPTQVNAPRLGALTPASKLELDLPNPGMEG